MAFRLSREGNYFVVLNTDNDQPDKYPGGIHVDISDNNQDANTVYTLRWHDGDNNRVIAKGVFSDYQDSTGSAYVSNGSLENFLDNNGHYAPSQGTNGTVVDFNDNIKDVFGNPVFVQPQTLFEINHIDSDQNNLEDEITDSGATVTRNVNRSALEMTVTATTGSRAVRQLHGYYSYQPGKAIQCFYTGVPLDTDTGDIRVRIGSFDNASDKSVGVLDGNGVFFQYNETIGDGWSVVIRSFTSGSQVDTKISQANWNQDTADGSKDENNPSGFNLNVTDKTIFYIQYGWLGLAPVVFGIDDPVLGKIVLHKETHTAVSQNMYMSRASLPYRYEIEQLGSTTGGTLSKFCTSIDSLGGHNPTGQGFTADREENTISVNTSRVPIVSVRLKSAFNRRQMIIDGVSLASTTSANVKYMVVLNPVLDAPVWVDVENADSGVEKDITSTSYTGGIQIPPTGYISNNNSQGELKLNTVNRISSDEQGNSDVISLVAVKIGGGGSETVTGAINGSTII